MEAEALNEEWNGPYDSGCSGGVLGSVQSLTRIPSHLLVPQFLPIYWPDKDILPGSVGDQIDTVCAEEAVYAEINYTEKGSQHVLDLAL